SKLTGESIERINKHKINLRNEGWSYLKMKNFIHRSTDGPDNVYATVWTKKTARKLFYQYPNFSTSVHFLNERHLMGFQYILPSYVKRFISHRFGWHLWIKANK
ncbi:MAG: hypothetical protein ACM3H8_05580, partial [Sphingobacteriales bacterium]